MTTTLNLTTLAVDLEKYSELLAAFDTEKNKIMADYNELQAVFNEVSNNLQQLEKENLKNKNAITELTKKASLVTDLENMKVELSKQLEDKKVIVEENELILLQLHQVQEILEEKLFELDDLRSKYKGMAARDKSKDEKLNGLVIQIKQSAKKIKDLEASNLSNEQKYEGMSARYSKSIEKLDGLSARYAGMVAREARYKDKIGQLEEELSWANKNIFQKLFNKKK